MEEGEEDKLEAASSKAAEVWNILYEVIATLSENEKKKVLKLESAQLKLSGCQRQIEEVLYN